MPAHVTMEATQPSTHPPPSILVSSSLTWPRATGPALIRSADRSCPHRDPSSLENVNLPVAQTGRLTHTHMHKRAHMLKTHTSDNGAKRCSYHFQPRCGSAGSRPSGEAEAKMWLTGCIWVFVQKHALPITMPAVMRSLLH